MRVRPHTGKDNNNSGKKNPAWKHASVAHGDGYEAALGTLQIRFKQRNSKQRTMQFSYLSLRASNLLRVFAFPA